MERAKIFTCLICTLWFLLGPAVYGQTEPVEAADPTREQSSVQTPSAQQCLQAAVEAIGPIPTFDAIESVRFRGVSRSLTGDSGPATTDILFYFPADREGLWMHSQHRYHDSPQAFLRTLAGESGTMQGTTVLTPELHRDAVRYASTKLLTLLRHREHPEAKVSHRGVLTGDAGVIDLVAVTLHGFSSELEIERATGRILAVRFPSSEIQEGEGGEIVRRAYSDYRPVGGLLLPFRQDVTVGGRPFTQWQIETITLDEEVDPELFAVPGRRVAESSIQRP